MEWLRDVEPRRRDALAALVFGVGWFGGIWFALGHGWYPTATSTYYVCGLFTVAVLLTRTTWPRATVFVVAISYPIAYRGVLSTEFHLLPILLAAYWAAAKGRLAVGWILLAVEPSVVTLFILPTALRGMLQRLDFWAWDMSRIGLTVAATAFVVLLGRAAQRQSDSNAELRRRNVELERLRRIETEQVILAERTRIARELHDVLAHHISAVVIRAQAADRVADARPDATREAVRWIAATGQDTLTAMRHVVRVLRSREPGGALTPQTSLAELPQIADRMAAVGLQVELRVPATIPALPAAVELAAVRIIQEALTNVLVHAEAGHARVELEIGPGDGLRLAIHDDGATGPPPPPEAPIDTGRGAPVRAGLGGNGLIGMRERAVSCGGALAVGTSPLGGWLVTAVLRSTLEGVRLTPRSGSGAPWAERNAG